MYNHIATFMYILCTKNRSVILWSKIPCTLCMHMVNCISFYDCQMNSYDKNSTLLCLVCLLQWSEIHDSRYSCSPYAETTSIASLIWCYKFYGILFKPRLLYTYDIVRWWQTCMMIVKPCPNSKITFHK